MADSLGGKSVWKSIKMLFLVHFFMLVGFFVMLVLALYGDSIEV